MPKRFENDDPKHLAFSMPFGGGMNTRTRPEDLDDSEATLSENTRLDIDRKTLQKRYPMIPLCALGTTATDGSTPIDAIIGPILHSNHVDFPLIPPVFLVQSGTSLYSYQISETNPITTGLVNPTPVATLGAGAKLNYTSSSYSEADGFGVITDLNLVEKVKKVSVFYSVIAGSVVTIADLGHGLANTELYAKYSFVQNDRLWLANIKTIVTTGPTTSITPHLIAASTIEDLESFSVTNRPSSSLGPGDPFYLPSPDLKAINGITTALGSVVFSTQLGSMFNLLGSSEQDFFLNPLYAGSGASGDKSMTFAGNDVAFYSQGALQSLAGSEAFGDVEVDDYSRPVQRELKEPFENGTTVGQVAEASVAYVASENTLYVHKAGENNLWAFNKSFHDQKAKDVSLLREGTRVSAWTKITSGDTGVFNVVATGGISGIYATNPLVLLPAEIVAPVGTSWAGTRATKKMSTLLVGTPEGVVYYIDYLNDPISNEGSYTQSSLTLDVTGDGSFGYADLTPYEESFTVKHTSKVFNAPSGVELKDLTGVIHYVPRETVEPAITVSIEFQGRRRRTVSKQITLNNHPDAGDYRKKSKKFSMQGGKATAMQVTVEWATGELIEILGIDFTLNA